ncbi:hypothetical protein PMIN03_010349 [Paraphaeosphaeria minitans]
MTVRTRKQDQVREYLQAPAQLAKRLPAKRPSFGTVISHFTSPPYGPARLALLSVKGQQICTHRLCKLLQTPTNTLPLDSPPLVAAKRSRSRSRHSLSRAASHPPILHPHDPLLTRATK